MCSEVTQRMNNFCSFLKERWDNEIPFRILVISIIAIAIIAILCLTLI